MAYVVINVLTVPAGRGDTLEQRFAGRAGMVEKAPGFEHFELLRPVEGTQAYLVYTRWHSKPDYEAWMASQSFERAHGSGQGQSPAPAEAHGHGHGEHGHGEHGHGEHGHGEHGHGEHGHGEHGHGEHGHGEQAPQPAATGSEIWSFEAVQLVDAGPDQA
jgi:heme-degrading monooxygenase HmoA